MNNVIPIYYIVKNISNIFIEQNKIGSLFNYSKIIIFRNQLEYNYKCALAWILEYVEYIFLQYFLRIVLFINSSIYVFNLFTNFIILISLGIQITFKLKHMYVILCIIK